MPIIFEKNMIIDDEFRYIGDRLSDGFKIDINDKSIIMFGYNGIGKSSIFKCIKKRSQDPSIEYIEYSDGKNDVIKMGNPIEISAYINQMDQLRKEIFVLKNQVDLKKQIKDNFGISTQIKARHYGNRVFLALTNVLSDFVKSNVEIANVTERIGDVSKKAFLENIGLLKDIVNIQNELNNDIKLRTFNILNNVNNLIDNQTTICPVCESSITDLKTLVIEKMNRLNGIKSLTIEKFRDSQILLNETQLDSLIQASRLLNDTDLLQDFILCNGDYEKKIELEQMKTQIETLERRLMDFQNEAEYIYRNLKNVEQKLKRDFKNYFKIEDNDIDFDDNNFKIVINLPRHLDNFSTGEVNLMIFLFKIYSFIGSDKTLVILDDPVSSLDIINHYKIAYEIVKLSVSKKVIVLTHSIELLNVLHSQFSDQFEYYYIEEFNNKLFNQRVFLRTNNSNIITLENLLSVDNNHFIQLLIIKENSIVTDEIHKLFHYTPTPFMYLDFALTNHDLIQRIDNYTFIENIGFLENSYQKIFVIAAMRVWLENQLYNLIPVENHQIRNDFLLKNTLSEKINFLLPRNGEPLINLPTNIDRVITASLLSHTFRSSCASCFGEVVPLNSDKSARSR